MNFWVTVKKLNERGKKKRPNAKLECRLTGPHAFPNKVSAFIYIYIYIDFKNHISKNAKFKSLIIIVIIIIIIIIIYKYKRCAFTNS